MKKEAIITIFESLAQSNGSYGRLLYEVKQRPDILQKLEDMNFKDSLDLILFLES